MADIIVNDLTPRRQYTAGGGGPTVFNYTFPIFDNTDLKVYLTPNGTVANDVANLLTYNVNYTVNNNAAPNVGGSITLNVAANAGDVITIVRDQPDNRLNNYIDGGLFQATDVNTDFDRTVFMAQQNKMYDQVLGLHYNNSAVLNAPTVDSVIPVLQPNNFWVMNPNGTGITQASVLGGNNIPVSTPIPWTIIVGNQLMVANNGYIVNGNLGLTFPGGLVVGQNFWVTLLAGSWTITQAAGQQIQAGVNATTAGVGGSLASTAVGDTVQMIAVSATKLQVVGGFIGNLTIT